MGITS